MANKKTKRELFGEVREIVEREGRTDLIEFVDHELELLEKKANRTGTTKTQKENEDIKEKIIRALICIAEPVTITELQRQDERMAEYSNQKLSALLTQLVNANKVIRTKDKKTTLFTYNDEQR